jgi:hypothetical protein
MRGTYKREHRKIIETFDTYGGFCQSEDMVPPLLCVDIYSPSSH